MARRRADGEQGFVITLELILIFTILGIGLLVGIVAIRNALFVWWQKKQSHTVWVYDSTPAPAGPRVLGPVRDFDEHEAPRLFYIDRSLSDAANLPPNTDVAWGGYNYRAFLGVRDDRFTSRHRIFYENSFDCGVTSIGPVRQCIAPASDEEVDDLHVGRVPITVTDGGGTVVSTGVSEIIEAGGIGYLYPLQGGPSYGIGRDLNNAALGLPGTLFRETTTHCDESIVHSRWTSQKVVSGLPCEPLPGGVTIEAAKCPDGQGGAAPGDACNISPNVDTRCVTGGQCVGGVDDGFGCYQNAQCSSGNCDITPLICSCPVGWANTSGANCCPPGTTEVVPGQCSIGDVDALRVATPVQRQGVNALSTLTPPFRVNLPPDPASFVLLTPTGTEGGGFGTPGQAFDPSDPTNIDFNVPPAGGESGPP